MNRGRESNEKEISHGQGVVANTLAVICSGLASMQKKRRRPPMMQPEKRRLNSL